MFGKRKDKKDNFFIKLIKTDNNMSVSNFFLLATTIVGLVLLLVPMGLFIEFWFNHTIATDLTGMAAYIIAVCGVFSVGGITHGWTEWSSNKYNSMKDDLGIRDDKNYPDPECQDKNNENKP